jgi:tRNA pseudouridine38-40 synthase
LSYRYFIKLDYNGSAFHGWQIQPNAVTIQELINNALSKLLKENINTIGCGRTDTGVHARNFIAHFNSDNDNLHLDNNLIFKLNRFLPKEIVIHKISKMDSNAHCRFDATARTYKYYISKNKDPFIHMYSLNHHHKLDIELMNNATKKLFDYSDFTSFSKVDTDSKTNICEIMEAYWTENDKQIIFTIKADRFLRNMVRAIVGTLLDIGKHKINIDDFCEIIRLKDRTKAGASAPAHALFLELVEYNYPI